MNDKEIVAQAALKYIKDNTIVGLGTGSTANYFIEGLAKKIKNENLDIKVVASSTISQISAIKAGLTYVSLDQIETIDLYVDGADEIAFHNRIEVLKGRGYDLIREKLLAKASIYVLIDNSKLVSRIGENYPIPIEVVPFSWQIVLRSLQEVGGEGGLRLNANGEGLVTTSHGSLVLDMVFDSPLEGNELNAVLNSIPGVVEHGIFSQLATHIVIGKNGEIEER